MQCKSARRFLDNVRVTLPLELLDLPRQLPYVGLNFVPNLLGHDVMVALTLTQAQFAQGVESQLLIAAVLEHFELNHALACLSLVALEDYCYFEQ